MARDALGKLREADAIHAIAVKIAKRDPGGAAALEGISARKVRQAVRQLRTRPRRKGAGVRVVI